jgi:hypothetical protein
MTTLFDATVRRNLNRSFGRGLLRSLPTARSIWSDDDDAWAAAEFASEFNPQASAFDRELERRAQEAAWTDSYCRGCLPL